MLETPEDRNIPYDALTARFYPEIRFGGFTKVDGTVAFYNRVNALLKPDFTVLDIGCGRGAHSEDKVPYRRDLVNLKGKVKQVIGIDVDEAGSKNPTLDEFRLIDGDRWPVDDVSIDLARCDCVLEHIADPKSFFCECARVLKPGGYLCIRTPNKYGYVAILSRLIPERFHVGILKKAHDKDDLEKDVFRTYYRCNTRMTLRHYLTMNRFDHAVYYYDAEPSYLMFSTIAYALGKICTSISPPLFRSALFCFARKANKGSTCKAMDGEVFSS